MNPQSSHYPIGQFVHSTGYYLSVRILYMPMHYQVYKCSPFGFICQCTEAPPRWSLLHVVTTISDLWAGVSSGQRSDNYRGWSTTGYDKTYHDSPPDGHTNVSRIYAPPVSKLLIQKILNMGNRSPLSMSRERSVRQGGRMGDNNIRR
jgi:hypothetical protein